MLPRFRRISRKLFKPLLATKRIIHSEHFTLRVGPIGERARVTVSVSKKISKKAVVRNRVRRRVYTIVKELLVEISPRLYLLITKSGADKIKGEALKNELTKLIRVIIN